MQASPRSTDVNPETVWLTYASTWTAVSLTERRKRLARSVTEQFVYTDPTTRREGHDEPLNYIELFQAETPGGSFRTDEFTEHHNQGLIRWTRTDGSRSAIGHGASYVRFGDDQRLSR
jgi:hypothetical protein